MAEKAKPQDAKTPTGLGHNSDDMNRLINECVDGLLTIDRQRKGLNDQAGKIRKRAEEAGIDKKALMNTVALAKMEDDVARDAYENWRRRLYEARFGELAIGGQAELFPATEADIEAARREGQDAAVAGEPRADNPFEKDGEPAQHVAWHQGFDAAARKRSGADDGPADPGDQQDAANGTGAEQAATGAGAPPKKAKGKAAAGEAVH